MSGIFGVLERGGAVETDGLSTLLQEALRHRGPDGIRSVKAGSATIGHCLLDVGRNGLEVESDYIISFDGRLDNRDDLATDLSVSPQPARDGSLVLAAYRRWGEDCVEHLLGDFAFAIYDIEHKKLFCGRDHFGVRPFFYGDTKDVFIFSSEARALLLAVPALGNAIDQAYLADYIAGHAPSADQTLYPKIKRLPPGHVCTLSDGKLRLRRYYALELGEPVERPDAPERLAEIFEEAVRCRLQTQQPVAALLSGGLDSSAITSVAAPLLKLSGHTQLRTFSMVFPDNPELDEREFIDAVAETSDIDPYFFNPDNVSPYERFDHLLSINSHPPMGLNLATTSALNLYVAEHGVRVLLDGHAGDEALYYGALRMADLAYAGAWVTLWHEISALAPNYGLSKWRYFVNTILQCGPHRLLRRSLGNLRRIFRPQGLHVRGLNYLSTGFARATGIRERHGEPPLPARFFGKEERRLHHKFISSELQSYAHESLDLIASHAGMEMRFPFLDKRLIEFAMSLPSSEKMGAGYTRLILRRAMIGRLPDLVRLRTSKVDFLPHIERGLVSHSRELVEELMGDKDGELERYININLFRRIWHSVKAGEAVDGFDLQALARVVAFGLWLRSPSAAFLPKGA